MPSHPTVRCQRQRLNFIRRGPGVRNPVKRACFSTASFSELPTGRSDWRSSPPAAKSAVFYRRSGTKSRHRTPTKAKLVCSDFAVEAGTVSGDHCGRLQAILVSAIDDVCRTTCLPLMTAGSSIPFQSGPKVASAKLSRRRCRQSEGLDSLRKFLCCCAQLANK